MEVESADEKFISDLYRHYQENRDDIDQQALLNIKKAVKIYLNSNAETPAEDQSIYQHKVMDTIRQHAHQRYIKNRITDNSLNSDSRDSKGFQISDLVKQITDPIVDILKKPVWLAGLGSIAIALFLFVNQQLRQTPMIGDLMNGYQSASLIENHDFVANQINTSVDWQYGFVLEDPSGRDAFVAGAYLVDILNLNESVNTKEVRALLQQLSEINSRINDENIQREIDHFDLQSEPVDSLATLIQAFENYYSKQPEKEFFEFGKWMEFNYLQTKLALKMNDTSVYMNTIQAQINFIKSFNLKGNYPDFIKQDLDLLLQLYTSKNVSIVSLQKQLKLLEKLRILLF